MSWIGLTTAIAFGGALRPVAKVILFIIGLFILAGMWGVITGGEQ